MEYGSSPVSISASIVSTPGQENMLFLVVPQHGVRRACVSIALSTSLLLASLPTSPYQSQTIKNLHNVGQNWDTGDSTSFRLRQRCPRRKHSETGRLADT